MDRPACASPLARPRCCAGGAGLPLEFSTELAERYGHVLSDESRAMRQDVIYAPMLNIVRVPQGVADSETLGEDPLPTQSSASPGRRIHRRA